VLRPLMRSGTVARVDQVRGRLFLGEQYDGSGVTVAVLDSGIDPEHPDLKSCLDAESSELVCPGRDILDRGGHGTHIAGIIAGSGAASDGKYRGIAPGVRLVALKVKTDQRGFTDSLAKGVERAVDLGADIINYSGGRGPSDHPPWIWSSKLSAVDEMFCWATDQGVLCICAAGNAGPESGSITKPGLLEPVLCVGALGQPENVVTPTSSRGPVYLDRELPVNYVGRYDSETNSAQERQKPDVVAPGGGAQSIYGPTGPVSTRSRHAEGFPGLDPEDIDELYGQMSGTSQATAVVSGLAALAIQAGNGMGFDWGANRAETLKRIILDAAQPLKDHSPDDQGNGMLFWPLIHATIVDCYQDVVRRRAIIDGPQLRLLP